MVDQPFNPYLTNHQRWFNVVCLLGRKNIFKPPVVYSTDRSRVVVPVLFLILCNFVVYTTERLMF